ncbi:MAG: beta-propeller domain-containing protein, partial [Myxococcaceae bacterium]|nr:beta-propeller domain-containing protein [Myxococcaceae bacterium]
GFSTYMHPVGADHPIAIGFEAEDKGSFAYFQGLQLQIFDVREPTQPKLVHKHVIGTRGSASAAATDHLAFNYLADRELLALPMAICENSSGGSSYGRMTFEGLLVFKASLTSGFEQLGGIAHGEPEPAPVAGSTTQVGRRCSNWWSNSTSHVKRSVFMDDAVYSVASDVVRAQRLGALGTDVAAISLK